MKQYIVFYPEGTYIDPATNEQASNRDLADQIAKGLLQGATVCLPNTWRVQVVDAPTHLTINPHYTQGERDLLLKQIKDKKNYTPMTDTEFQEFLEREYP